jgi:DNA-binding transcriptional ArsR family regulator
MMSAGEGFIQERIMAIGFQFGSTDLRRVRFATSPVFETLLATRTLVDPRAVTYVRPWWDAVRGLPLWTALTPLLAVQPRVGETPDFLTPPPTSAAPTFADQLAQVRATPPDLVEHELGMARTGQTDPRAREVVDTLRRDPGQALDVLCEALELAWEHLVSPWWPRVRDALNADIAHRSRILAEHGVGDAVVVHAQMRWAGDRLDLGAYGTEERVLGGDGLIMVPSAFTWPSVLAVTGRPWQPTLVYPVRGVSAVWTDRPVTASRALARLLGRTRARVLTALAEPASTTVLAARLGVAASGTSAHLTALHQAGLLARHRHGHEVRYQRTPLGELLVARAS